MTNFLTRSFVVLAIILNFSCSENKDQAMVVPGKDGRPDSVQSAFEHVLKLLHDPFQVGHCFFMTNFPDVKNVGEPQDFYVKNASKSGGSGSYKVSINTSSTQKGEGKPEDTVTYVYDNFQPKGSDLIVNGILKGSHWNRDEGSLRITKGNKLVFSGSFDAELEFLNSDDSEPFEITNGKGDSECGSMMTITKGKMLFTYHNDDIKEDLFKKIEFDSSCGCGDQARLEKLLKVRDQEKMK